jgi:hypothetical protein
MQTVTKGSTSREMLARTARRVGQLSIDAALGLYSGAQRLMPAEAVGGDAWSEVGVVQALCGSTLAQASNRARLLAWAAHQHHFHSGVPTQGFSADATHKLLFVTEHDPICRSQVFPFFYYQPELASRFGIQLREVSLRQFETQSTPTGPQRADTVCFQTWFDRTPEQFDVLVSKIREQNPDARVVYLDWFAPTDLRLAETLHDQVDLYVKKHVFRDRSQYAHPTFGDTNLMDFYGKLYGLPHETRQFDVPSDFFSRLVVGPSFATADYMLPKFLYGGPPSSQRPRPIDLHARISSKGTPWYNRMRDDASQVLSTIADLKVVSGTGIKRRAYLRELASSKLCFSPFGYGEVCWRDYEAVMCGSLLLKPDMSHVETNPDIFRAGETYVPLRWDFADLEEKARYYLAHPKESARIANNAFLALQQYFQEQRFIDQMRPIFDPAPSSGAGVDRASRIQIRAGRHWNQRIPA